MIRGAGENKQNLEVAENKPSEVELKPYKNSSSMNSSFLFSVSDSVNKDATAAGDKNTANKGGGGTTENKNTTKSQN